MSESLSLSLRKLAKQSAEENKSTLRELSEDMKQYSNMTDVEKRQHLSKLGEAQTKLKAEYQENERNSTKRVIVKPYCQKWDSFIQSIARKG